MSKIPAFFFYPRDWLSDANLRRCSPNARAVWIDMLCIMWECTIRGVLSTDGEAWTDNEIAESIPGDTYKNMLGIQELLRNRVAKRNEIGAVYSKRMVEDDRKRVQWRDRQNRKRERDVTGVVTPMSRRSSSSSSNLKSPLPPFTKGGTNRSRRAKPATAGAFNPVRANDPEYQRQVSSDIEEILKQHPELA